MVLGRDVMGQLVDESQWKMDRFGSNMNEYGRYIDRIRSENKNDQLISSGNNTI